MADEESGGPVVIDNPQAVRFVNEKIRVAADLWMMSYQSARALVTLFDNQGLANVIPADPNYVIADGAAEDGRPIVNGALVHGVLSVARSVVTFVEKAPTDEAGNETGPAAIRAIAGVAVNGASRF